MKKLDLFNVLIAGCYISTAIAVLYSCVFAYLLIFVGVYNIDLNAVCGVLLIVWLVYFIFDTLINSYMDISKNEFNKLKF